MIGDGINWQVYWALGIDIGTNMLDCIPSPGSFSSRGLPNATSSHGSVFSFD